MPTLQRPYLELSTSRSIPRLRSTRLDISYNGKQDTSKVIYLSTPVLVGLDKYLLCPCPSPAVRRSHRHSFVSLDRQTKRVESSDPITHPSRAARSEEIGAASSWITCRVATPAQLETRTQNNMTDSTRSLDSARLEIILIAIVVFVLVVLLAVFILLGVSFRIPRGARDAENVQRQTPWTSHSPTDQNDGAYCDNEASFIKSVRRRSHSLAEELRLELVNLRRNLSLLKIPSRSRLGNTDTDGTRRLSIDQLLSSFPSTSSELVKDYESCYDYLDSPLSATGREEDDTGTQRRLIRPTGNTTRYDQIQQWDTPLQ